MHTKKKIQWLGIFILLGAFTYSMISATFWNREINIARAATQSFSINDLSNNIVVFSGDQDGPYSKGFLKKITELYENQEICIVNDAQLDLLLKNYSARLQDVNVEGSTVTLIEVYSRITKNDLFNFLGSDKMDCKVLKRKNIFFLLFSPQIS